MTGRPGEALEPLVRIPGVRGALLVSQDDGLMVAESAMEGLDGGAVAALAASVVGKINKACVAGGLRPPTVVHLAGSHGSLLAAASPTGLLVVAVAAAETNVGLVRLALQDAASGDD